MTNNRILIVDDEAAIRDMLRMALEIVDYECLEAENIGTAHQIIVDERSEAQNDRSGVATGI